MDEKTETHAQRGGEKERERDLLASVYIASHHRSVFSPGVYQYGPWVVLSSVLTIEKSCSA